MFFETSINFDHRTGWSRTGISKLYQPGPLTACIFFADRQNIKQNIFKNLNGMRVKLIKH
jgi:hypothetical protein